MNMPGFNADATLYKTSWHYQTSRNMINLPTQGGSAIYAAMMEQIDIHGCAPGSTLWEEGGDWGCIPDEPFGGGGGGGGGGPSGGEPSGGGGGGPPPKPPPKTPGHVCSDKEGGEMFSGPEWNKIKQDCKNLLGTNAYMWCVSPKSKTPVRCCARKGGQTTCVGLENVPSRSLA
jgi:hypothetical protein